MLWMESDDYASDPDLSDESEAELAEAIEAHGSISASRLA